MKVALIGTRAPTVPQISYLHKFIDNLDTSTTIISGCCVGIDQKALIYARKRINKLRTVCVVPWEKKYSFVDELIVMSNLSEELRREAYESVAKYHPARGGNKVSALFHARNYLIIKMCDIAVALPSTKKKSLGGTGQGIRVALGLGKPITVIGEDGHELTDYQKYL